MPSERNEAELRSALLTLVEGHAQQIFGLSGSDLQSVELSVGKPMHGKGDRYHRLLTVRYATGSGVRRKGVWLKFRKDFQALYEIHSAVWDRTRQRSLFPKPYFYGEFEDESLIGMEVVHGASLRDLLLRRAAGRRTGSLRGVFEQLGTGVRAFHDSSEPDGAREVRDLAANARRVTEATRYLTLAERREVVRHIERAEARLAPEVALPLIKIHHDCSLRNVIVRDDGSPCLIDLDSMRAPVNSRWYDVSTLLINMESQTKYHPLVSSAGVMSMWRSFWDGYAEQGLPDGLTGDEVAALTYLTKVEYLFGGTFREPLFEVYTGRLDARYLTRAKRTVIRGEHLAVAAG